MVLRSASEVRQGEQTREFPHHEAHRDGAFTKKLNVLTIHIDRHHDRDNVATSISVVEKDCDIDEIMTRSSSDVEKGEKENRRAYLFLGRPMSVAHELAFFAVVSTANFTPRGFPLYSSTLFFWAASTAK
jgi:hypothetical protein